MKKLKEEEISEITLPKETYLKRQLNRPYDYWECI
jgi:hypothetical protein